MTQELDVAALPDTDQLIRRAALSLPKKAASVALTLLSGASWFMAPVNLLNFLTGLKSAAELWTAIYRWFAGFSLNLRPLQDGLDALFAPWRAVVRPMRDWVSAHLPALPAFTADLLLMALISLPALIRLASNYLQVNFNAAKLVLDLQRAIELGDPDDPLIAQLDAELKGPKRWDVLQDLISQRLEGWQADAIAAAYETARLIEAGETIDPASPEEQARERAGARAVAIAGAGVGIANLQVLKFHIRDSLKLLRFTAMLSLIGAALVALDHLLR